MEMVDRTVLALPGGRRTFAALVVSAVLSALLITGQAVSLSSALAALWDGASLASQLPLVGAFAGCYALQQLVACARHAVMERFAGDTNSDLLKRLSERTFDGGQRFVQVHGSGVVGTALIEGIDRVRAYIALAMPKSADLMVIPAVLTVSLLALDWISGIIALVMIPFIVLFMRLLGANSREAAAAQRGEYDRLTNHFADTLRGLPTIKLFGRSRHYDEVVYEQSEQLREATNATLKTVTLSSLVLDLFRTFALAAIAIMLGFRLMDGSVALAPALAVLIIVPEYFAAIRRYSADFHTTLEGKNQLAAMLDMLDEEQDGAASLAGEHVCACEPASTSERAPTRADLQSPEHAPALNLVLALEHISYTYPADDERAFSLRDVTFEAAAPMKVGIVGASGSGKSTLVRLLAGFETPDDGSRFVLNGEPLGTLATRSWQDRVTFIPQDPHIFSGTLAENVAFYCPEASDGDVMRAVRAVGLEATVNDLSDGLRTAIGQGGRQLSGGQAQRVALARAFLDANRSVWLFDEPTAHLDIETELALKETMLPLMEGKLVFFATHRLHWMRDMDLLVVLDGGRVVETGGYDELMAADGTFARLVRALSGSVHPDGGALSSGAPADGNALSSGAPASGSAPSGSTQRGGDER